MRVVIRNQVPIYGDSTAVFVSSGILPFYVYLRVSMRTRGVRYNAASRVPGASSTDYAIASALAEVVVMVATMVMWFAAMWAYGLDSAEPASIVNCLEPLTFLILLGFGIGLVNSAISQRFSLWTHIYAYMTYGLMFMSGVFFVVDLVPPHIREFMIWNPIAHGIEWFRLGIYGQYLVHTLDREYLVGCSATALFLGFVAHRATLRTE
jgi:capsular polysaccharide transport system permease protein